MFLNGCVMVREMRLVYPHSFETRPDCGWLEQIFVRAATLGRLMPYQAQAWLKDGIQTLQTDSEPNIKMS